MCTNVLCFCYKEGNKPIIDGNIVDHVASPTNDYLVTNGNIVEHVANEKYVERELVQFIQLKKRKLKRAGKQLGYHVQYVTDGSSANLDHVLSENEEYEPGANEELGTSINK